MSKRGRAPSPDLEIYFNSVPPEKRSRLDKSLDYDHGGVQRDLGIIASSIDQWEGNIAEQLQLTRPEIQAIKTEFPGQLPLQTRAALQKWQEKFGLMATYRALITAFVRAGRGDCAEALCRVIGFQAESHCDSVPQTPIQRYAMYLKGVYQSANVSSDKFPNLTCGEFINLALVKSCRISRSEADEFTRATLHGHVDEILQKKESIKLEEVMKPVEGQHRMKCVYIHGAPGVGKSTCVGELCRRWDEIDTLKEYSLVILLPLREKQVQEALSMKDLCYHEERELQVAVAAEIARSEGKGVLFVLDGFDELPASLQKDSIFVKLIRGTYLSHCTVLVTSRPSATADLLRVARGQILKQIEVIGFTQKHIQKYAQAFFASQPEVLTDFMTYISTQPAIRSLMYIPLNCAITAEIYSHNQTANRPIPHTMTQLYSEMSLTLLQRHLEKNDPLAEQLSETKSLENLSPQLQKPFSLLAQKAFEGLEKNEVIFHNICNSFVHFGFMNYSTELYMGRKSSISHSFLHLTLQEFLVAFYVSQLPPSDQQRVFENHLSGWDMVWRFVAGLTGFHGIGWEMVKAKKGKVHSINSKAYNISPFLIHCFYEAQQRVDCDLVLQGESEIYFLHKFNLLSSISHFDCFAIGYCVANTKCMWKLDLSRSMSLGGNVVVEMLRTGLYFSNKSPPKTEVSNIVSLDLSGCGLDSHALNQLADLIPLLINLKELDISNSVFTEFMESIVDLKGSVKFISQELNRTGHKIGCPGHNKEGQLVKLLHSLSHLQHFQDSNITGCKFSCSDMEALSHLILPSSSLKKLSIGYSYMSSDISEAMLTTILSPSSLEEVKFKVCSWTEKATNLLEKNRNLTTQGISIHDSQELASSVTIAMCKNSYAKNLSLFYPLNKPSLQLSSKLPLPKQLSSNPTSSKESTVCSDMYISSLVELLHTNQTLETLEIRSFYDLTEDQLLTINDALLKNHTLKTFTIDRQQQEWRGKELDPHIQFTDFTYSFDLQSVLP